MVWYEEHLARLAATACRSPARHSCHRGREHRGRAAAMAMVAIPRWGHRGRELRGRATATAMAP